MTLQCVSNEVGGNLVGNAVWQGVPLAALLDRAGVQAGATQIVGRSVDGFTAGFPTEVGLDGRTALVAVGDERRAAAGRHGFPARLVVAGLYGYVSATKWLDARSSSTTWEDFDGYWMPRGWSKEGPIKTAVAHRRAPRGAPVAAGPQADRRRGVGADRAASRGSRCRSTTGRGARPTLGDAASGNTWVQWYVDWDATPGEHRHPGAGHGRRRRDADRGARAAGARRGDRLAHAARVEVR